MVSVDGVWKVHNKSNDMNPEARAVASVTAVQPRRRATPAFVFCFGVDGLPAVTDDSPLHIGVPVPRERLDSIFKTDHR